ncbi:TOBE domain-containing protein [Phyllobacterium sp. A18/5-2]|uniref:TOBE domain-containing protein n=1 Tax=Phyllobacterium sp. A18/5-2 TaxID=2978392 RepID=UPI003965ACBE
MTGSIFRISVQGGNFNCLEAAVVGEEFIGAAGIVHLEVEHGLELSAQKSHAELEHLNLSPGSKVWFSWPAGAAHVLPIITGLPLTRGSSLSEKARGGSQEQRHF